jgi:GNAT superfamily N-acetyltransferase
LSQIGPVTIRFARRADCGILLQFIQALAEYEKLAHQVVATEAQLEETLFGQHPGAEVLIAESAGEAAGFALFFGNYSTFLGRPGIYLEDLFVYPRFRGHGVGKGLLSHIAAIAVERGCGRLDWSVLDWNQSAIDFYHGLGARGMTDWTQYRLDGDHLARLASAHHPIR